MAEPQEQSSNGKKSTARWWQPWWDSFLTVLPLVVVLLLMGLVSVIIAGYWFAWPWAGLTWYIDPTGDYHPDKTLWDWLSLLFVPVVIGVAAYVFRRTEQNFEQLRAEERARVEKEAAQVREMADRELARAAQHETTLQTYLDQMTHLLLDKGLRTSKEGEEIRIVARVRTLITLHTLEGDRTRKATVVKFLYEAGLIGGVEAQNPSIRFNAVIGLRGADLSGADLRWADLRGVDLDGADLHGNYMDLSDDPVLGGSEFTYLTTGADLRGAYLNRALLRRADLRGAYLGEAHLDGADLHGADLSEAYLYGATVTPEQLVVAKSVEGATLPFSLETHHVQDSRGQSPKTQDKLLADLLTNVG